MQVTQTQQYSLTDNADGECSETINPIRKVKYILDNPENKKICKS